MGIHLITYGDSNYTWAKQLIHQEAIDSGWFDSIECHAPETLPQPRRSQLRDILAAPRGGGFWIWKPLIIQRRLSEIAPGDILVYADAGCLINPNGRQRLQQYVEMLQANAGGVLSFQSAHPEETYTRQDVFDFYGVPTGSPIRTSGQIIATVQLYRNTPAAHAILHDVLRAVDEAPHLFSDDYARDLQAPGFKDHRHDQSIFSVVRKLHGGVVLPDETWASDWSELSTIPFWAKRRRLGKVPRWYSRTRLKAWWKRLSGRRDP